MTDKYNIAGYCRISVDEELDRDNTSIENQKSIIADFVKHKFPKSKLSFYEDRDRSGYTFEQREGYQKMRPLLMSKNYDILIVKDFSRFSRRNSRGLVELEDLRDAGVRIISINDSIDYPTFDDWTAIQFRFLVNEMPVTDASKKVKSVINRRQEDGKWICAVPYGYVITNSKAMTFEVVPDEAEIVKKVFELYNNGWGYKRIANHLTEMHIPTPRAKERERKETLGEECKIKSKPEWSIITIQGILNNDFYIGTLRQGKYTRAKINGKDVKKAISEQHVFENDHEAIIDYHTFAVAEQELQKRTRDNYRGVKKYDNTYSGFLVCGDCGSPMFSMSRPDLKDAYRCGMYHKRGLKGCTSHHTRVDILDSVLKMYLKKVRDGSSNMIAKLEESIKNEEKTVNENEDTSELLAQQMTDAKEELKALVKQKTRELMRKPENEKMIDETYDELMTECQNRIDGLQNQIELSLNKRNTIIRVNRIAKTAIGIFDEILNKDKLDKQDLELIIEKIIVYEDHIEVKLKSDIDSLLKCGELPDERDKAANFKLDIADILKATVVQTSTNRKDKVYDVNVISSGDPLEIFTDRDGEVIFKKYSPIGELSQFAAQYAETLNKTCGLAVIITDRDAVIACAGLPKREYADRKLSAEFEGIIEGRALFSAGGEEIPVVDGSQHYVSCAMPIITEGDITGCVASVRTPDSPPLQAGIEQKLIQTAAGFLGRQLES